MNKRFLSVLIFAFMVAAGASTIVYRLLIGRINTSAEAATVKILVASRNLEAGTILRERDLKPVSWFGAIPDGSFMKPSDLNGRAVAIPMYENEPVLEKRLGPLGSSGGLAAMIPTGMRAVAIRVNDVAGVAGFVIAGSHVDVLVSSGGGSGPAGGGGGFSLGSRFGVSLPSINIPTPSGDSDPGATRTLLQNILVLSAGQEFKRDSEGKPVTVQVVNLLVTPTQAEMLSLAGNQMTMQLVLRNPADNQIANTRGVSMSNIFTVQTQAPPPPAGAEPAQGAPAPQPAIFTRNPIARPAAAKAAFEMPLPRPAPKMEIIAGSKRTEVELQFAEAR